MTLKSEILYLLHFFSQSQEEQWTQVPDTIGPVWVRVGVNECATDKPIRFLTVVLVDHLNGCGEFFPEGNLDILDDIRVLLGDWMLESPYMFVFAKRSEPDQLDLIWRVVARLCRLALGDSNTPDSYPSEVTFEYFMGKYTHPLDSTFGAPIL